MEEGVTLLTREQSIGVFLLQRELAGVSSIFSSSTSRAWLDFFAEDGFGAAAVQLGQEFSMYCDVTNVCTSIEILSKRYVTGRYDTILYLPVSTSGNGKGQRGHSPPTNIKLLSPTKDEGGRHTIGTAKHSILGAQRVQQSTFFLVL